MSKSTSRAYVLRQSSSAFSFLLESSSISPESLERKALNDAISESSGSYSAAASVFFAPPGLLALDINSLANPAAKAAKSSLPSFPGFSFFFFRFFFLCRVDSMSGFFSLRSGGRGACARDLKRDSGVHGLRACRIVDSCGGLCRRAKRRSSSAEPFVKCAATKWRKVTWRTPMPRLRASLTFSLPSRAAIRYVTFAPRAASSPCAEQTPVPRPSGLKPSKQVAPNSVASLHSRTSQAFLCVGTTPLKTTITPLNRDFFK
mmetsp:Transcript_33102/g.64527  ORF Transcript_33102/g.64527 Transcript_33102/m.64527 type:complete len:260 (+) Transcript_33102:234-1013(+)